MVSIINCYFEKSDCCCNCMITALFIISILLVSGVIAIILSNIEAEKTKRLEAEIRHDWEKVVLRKVMEKNSKNENIEEICNQIKLILETTKN